MFSLSKYGTRGGSLQSVRRGVVVNNAADSMFVDSAQYPQNLMFSVADCKLPNVDNTRMSGDAGAA